LFDEPGIPARDPPVHEHTRSWSRKVASLQGFVFVTPQYNWGYPAALKNALDYLYVEWNGKPAVIVTYGSHGGRKCAEQLQQVLTGLKMSLPTAALAISITREHQQHGIDFETAQRDFSAYRSETVEMAATLERAVLSASTRSELSCS
jgi:NAD(P)H-dependent FMN reductase